MQKIFIIDLMPFLYRGHFVFLKNPRLTASGINTSALIGFANGLTAILKDNAPTHAVIAMDSSTPTFRHQAYPAYKAQREKMPEDLAASIPYAFELAAALRIPVVKVDGFEADDVMGTLAKTAAAAGFEVYLATPDKDIAQLVGPHVKLFRPGKSGDAPEIYDEAMVKEHWHLSSPAQMVDYLGLAGDTADNIPGIHGVGEKTAATLLAQYGSVENLIAHAAELKGKLAEKVAAGAADAKQSKFLAAIRTDVPLAADLESFRLQGPDIEKLKAVCAKFELNTLAKRWLGDDVALGGPAAAPFKTAATTLHAYTLVKTMDAAAALAKTLEAAPLFAFDTETTGLTPRLDRLVGISFATRPGTAWFVAVPREFEEARKMVALFAPAFADPKKVRIGHNAKFDMTILGRYGTVFGAPPHDSLLEHYCLDAAERHGMDPLAREFLHYDPIPIEKLIGEKQRGTEQANMGDLAPEDICEYAAEDADVTLRLDAVLRPKVKEAGALKALEGSEEPLADILVAMEREGVKIDTAALKAYGHELEHEILGLMQSIKSYGSIDNLDSPKQLGEFLFGKLGLATGKKTAGGQFSTDEKTLVKLVEEHPVIQQILDYRACTKLKSTYVDKLPACIDPADGRVHTTFAQAFTETGRLSSSDPNLQNIPVRTERGKLIRAAVVARDADHVLVSADYSQIELRIMAAMSGDEAMLDAFAHGADIHRETAARVFDCMPALVSPEQRARCKMVNFGIIYGISAFGLGQRLHVPRHEAQDLIDTYFRLYPKIRAFMDSSIEKARKSGYAVTALGRRRTLRDIASRNATARQSAERDAINTPIQGTAADLIKLAMVKVDRAMKAEGLKAKMILQIHDELLFDTPLGEVEKMKEIARREMTTALDLGVPLEVGLGSGPNWLNAH